jgi:hypothetical protein
MAKINFNLLRQRIHWVDDYAAGIKWSDLLAKYESEGIKPGRLQSAIEAAQKIGLISGSYSHEGTVSMNQSKREELMVEADPEVIVDEKVSSRELKRPSPPPKDSYIVGSSHWTLSALEQETLQEIAQERLRQKQRGNLRTGEPQDAPTSVRLDAGLWEGLLAYADREGIKRSEAMNRAIEALLLGRGQLLK